MGTFTTTCPCCGGVTLSAEEIELWVFPDGFADDFYAFTCPVCGERVTKPATAGTVELLRTGGVEPVAAAGHPEAPPTDLPPLTRQDLLAFHELLQRPDWFELLVGHPHE